MIATTTAQTDTHYVRLDSPLPGRLPKWEGPMTEALANVTAQAYRDASPWHVTVVPMSEGPVTL